MPTPLLNTCPQTVGSPFSNAFSTRNSKASSPNFEANSSNNDSCAMAACGTPKPRNAPDGGQFVWIPLASAK